MIGCPLVWWWAVAWRLGELSQHPMCPQLWHMRRWTQREPMARHSSHPGTSAGASRISTASRCAQVAMPCMVSRQVRALTVRTLTALHVTRSRMGRPGSRLRATNGGAMSTVGSTGTPATGNGQDASAAGQAKDKVQETAQQAAGQARGRVSEQVDQRSTQAGEQVSSTAEDVRTIAQQLLEQGKEQPAKLAEQAAQRADQLGDYLKRADGDAILHDIEDFGRRQPWAVKFGGLAAGVLASRFLKASSSRRYESRYEGARGSGTGGTPAPYGGPADRPSTVQPPATTVPPATTAPPAGGIPQQPLHEPGTETADTGRPAHDVSLTGGVVPAEAPGATRPGGAL